MALRCVRKESNRAQTLHFTKTDFGFLTKLIGGIQIDSISQRLRSLRKMEGLQGQYCPTAKMIYLCAWEEKCDIYSLP